MIIPITILDAGLPAWEFRLAVFNNGSGADPVDLGTYIQDRVDEKTADYTKDLEVHNLAQLASNPTMVEINNALLDMSPEDRASKLVEFKALLP